MRRPDAFLHSPMDFIEGLWFSDDDFPKVTPGTAGEFITFNLSRNLKSGPRRPGLALG